MWTDITYNIRHSISLRILQPRQPHLLSILQNRTCLTLLIRLSPTALTPLLPTLSPHTNSLDLSQLRKSIRTNHACENHRPYSDADKAEIGLFDKVFQVHAIEGGDEGPGPDAKSADAEFEVEEHEGVAVGVENGFYAAGVLVAVFGL